MFSNIVMWGSVVGVIHFAFAGAAYGNPWISKMYRKAEAAEPGVRRWESRKEYLITQFLGTQIEVFILTTCYFWLRPLLGDSGMMGTALLALALAAVRIYPRFWNMWIQSTYPSRLLAVEAIVGTLGTFVVIYGLEWLS